MHCGGAAGALDVAVADAQPVECREGAEELPHEVAHLVGGRVGVGVRVRVGVRVGVGVRARLVNPDRDPDPNEVPLRRERHRPTEQQLQHPSPNH